MMQGPPPQPLSLCYICGRSRELTHLKPERVRGSNVERCKAMGTCRRIAKAKKKGQGDATK